MTASATLAPADSMYGAFYPTVAGLVVGEQVLSLGGFTLPPGSVVTGAGIVDARGMRAIAVNGAAPISLPANTRVDLDPPF